MKHLCVLKEVPRHPSDPIPGEGSNPPLKSPRRVAFERRPVHLSPAKGRFLSDCVFRFVKPLI